MRKHFKKIVALMIVMTMTFTAIPQASAATKKQYISDMKISYDSEGRQKLIDNGYTVVKQDLNQDANSGSLKGNKAVYMGYKTTEQPNEAITDVAMMSEECGYSFSDYQETLKKEYAKYEVLAKKEMSVIKEFRENYKNNSPYALPAYESLNNFREDDSGKLVGDFLLDESLTEETLFKFITQVSLYTLTAINSVLAAGAAENTEENFFKRLSALSNGEIETIKKDHSFYDDAMIFYDQAEILKNNIKKAESTVKLLEERNENMETTEENLSFITEQTFVALRMQTIKYGDKNLYDVFMNDDISVQDLYPLVKVMTRGQIDTVGLTGFSQLFKTTNVATVNEIKDAQSIVAAEIEKPEVISAYFGVDRSMFTDAVAVTSKATREMSATGNKSPMWGNIASDTEIALAITAGVAGFVAIAAIPTLALLGSYVQRGVVSVKLMLTPSIVAKNLRFAKMGVVSPENTVAVARGILALNVVFYLAIAVMVIVTTVLFILELYNYYNPTYSKVPKILLDLYDEKDQRKFIRYDGVLGLDGEMADANGYVGKKWNAIYTTKDPLAGKPIEAKTATFSDNTTMTSKKYKAIHSFGETAPVNLKNYTFGSPKGIYLYFKQDVDYITPTLPLAGSVFTDIASPIAIGFLGIIIGFVGGAIIFKRRKKVQITTSENTTTQ